MVTYVGPAQHRVRTDVDIFIGGFPSDPRARLRWEDEDANANFVGLTVPEGGGVDVPVVGVGIGLVDVDLGMFDGFTEPFLGIIDADRDSYAGFHFSSDDVATLRMRLGSAGTVREHTIPDSASGTFALTSNTSPWTAAQTITVNDATNNAVTEVLTLNHNTTGTPANDIGVGLDFGVETSTTVATLAGSIDVIWTDVTHATRRSDMIFSVETDNDGVMEELMRLDGSTADVVFVDNTSVSLGTGGDSRIYYDGTDTFWDLRAVGTGDLMIALASGFPSPDPTTVHIWSGTAGTVSAPGDVRLVIEDAGSSFLSFLSGTTASAGIWFGTVDDNDVGGIRYRHNTGDLAIHIEASDRLLYSAAAFAFQEATTISTTTGALTLNPTTNIVLGANIDGDGAIISDIAQYQGRATASLSIRANDALSDATARRIDLATIDTVGNVSVLVAYAIPTATETTPFWAQRMGITTPLAGTLDANCGTFLWDSSDDRVYIYVNDGGTIRSTPIGTVNNVAGQIIVTGTDGIDYNPGSDVDTDLMTIGVTGTPLMFWDESQNQISLNVGIDITAGVITFDEVNDGNSGAADTIDWTTGQKHRSTLSDNVTYTFTDPPGPCNLMLILVQDATGSRTATWPATVQWPGGTAPTLSTAATAVDAISLYFDGTNYLSQEALNFS